ncbi:hypothetical protein bthur0004_30310 [Bacillus thuringiensis serovar sotto str. T04001]|nr:hypothetical protein bthur0004_30310 [Bacillus thuringiensis serovar sotto str. T04001]
MRATMMPMGIKPITELTIMPVVPRIEKSAATIQMKSNC